jgi:hypothetical protein
MKYEDLSYHEKLVCVRLFPEEAKKDENWRIRLAAYRVLGFDESAKKDEDWLIRLEAYRAFGFDENAKKDKNSNIRLEAATYFKIKAGLL